MTAVAMTGAVLLSCQSMKYLFCQSATAKVCAGQGEFSAVGFSYGGPAESSHAGASGPVEDLGEEACSDSESGQCISCILPVKCLYCHLFLMSQIVIKTSQFFWV